MNNTDVIKKYITKNGNFKVSGALCTNAVQKVNELHNCSPVIISTLGRFMIGSLFLATSLNGCEYLSVQLSCRTALEGMVATATPTGIIRAYPYVNRIENEQEAPIVDLSELLKEGFINVSKWIVKEKIPYNGIVALECSEISKDFVNYLYRSEQIPSAMSLGVYTEKDCRVSYAGGIFIQTLPGATIEEIEHLENSVNELEKITTLLIEGFSIEEIVKRAMKGFELNHLIDIPVICECNCNEEKIIRTLLSLGRNEIEKLIEDFEVTKIKFEFCNKNYNFSRKKLRTILNES